MRVFALGLGFLSIILFSFLLLLFLCRQTNAGREGWLCALHQLLWPCHSLIMPGFCRCWPIYSVTCRTYLILQWTSGSPHWCGKRGKDSPRGVCVFIYCFCFCLVGCCLVGLFLLLLGGGGGGLLVVVGCVVFCCFVVVFCCCCCVCVFSGGGGGGGRSSGLPSRRTGHHSSSSVLGSYTKTLANAEHGVCVCGGGGGGVNIFRRSCCYMGKGSSPDGNIQYKTKILY